MKYWKILVSITDIVHNVVIGMHICGKNLTNSSEDDCSSLAWELNLALTENKRALLSHNAFLWELTLVKRYLDSLSTNRRSYREQRWHVASKTTPAAVSIFSWNYCYRYFASIVPNDASRASSLHTNRKSIWKIISARYHITRPNCHHLNCMNMDGSKDKVTEIIFFSRFAKRA